MTVAVSDPAIVAHAAGFDRVLGHAPRLSRLAEIDASEGRVTRRE
jgi:hypothetical protein